jgi:predicted DNA-binding transcriptional regulator AlpA
MQSELLTVSEAARWAKVSESFLNKARLTSGDGPRFVHIGRSIRYRMEDLEAWVQSLSATSTSEYNGRAAL